MDIDDLVSRYIEAWNRQDVATVLDLMHKGAAYYDAFWMETCVGQDLPQYLRDAFDEEPYWYRQVGNTIRTEHGAVFRYSAHDSSDETGEEPIFFGAEVLVIHDGKILTVSDFYCSPHRAELRELANLVEVRHSVTACVTAGLGALRAFKLKSRLETKIGQDKVFLDPDISISELAVKIGCSLEQLSSVIEKQFGTSFEHLLDTHRVQYAQLLLEREADDPNVVKRTAVEAGFRSTLEFRNKFSELVGVTPREYCLRKSQDADSGEGAHLH